MALFGLFGRRPQPNIDPSVMMNMDPGAAASPQPASPQPASPPGGMFGRDSPLSRYDWGGHLALLGAGLRDLSRDTDTMGPLRQQMIAQRTALAKRAAMQKAIEAAKGSADPSAALYEAFSKDPLLAEDALQFLPKDKSPVSVADGSQLVDPDTGKVVYAAPEKAPGLPSGYDWSDPNHKAMVGIPGGPGDPKIIRQNAEARKIIINTGGPSVLADGDMGLEIAAQQYLKDRSLPPLGMGQQAASLRQRILKRAGDIAKEQGQSAEDVIAGQSGFKADASALKDIRTRRARLEQAEQFASRNLDLVVDAAKGVSRSGSPMLNRGIQWAQKNMAGDPALTRLDNAIDTFVPEYGKVMSGGNPQLTEGFVTRANKLLQSAMGPAQFAAAVDQLRKEMANQRPSYDVEEQRILDAMAHSGPTIGEVKKGYRYKGGPPGAPHSWEPVNGR